MSNQVLVLVLISTITCAIPLLGHCPSEAEIQEVLRDMEDPQEMGYINVDRFYSVMTKIIIQQKYVKHIG